MSSIYSNLSHHFTFDLNLNLKFYPNLNLSMKDGGMFTARLSTIFQMSAAASVPLSAPKKCNSYPATIVSLSLSLSFSALPSKFASEFNLPAVRARTMRVS